MFRLLGFFVGSLTSVIIILLIIGMPTFHLQDQEAAQQRYDAAIEKLRAKQEEIASVTGRLTEDVARVAESVESGLAGDEPAEQELPEAEIPPADMTTEPVVAQSPAPAEPPEQHWYSFWNPFRSEIAARGFVSQLERVTGIDYRVVKVGTGVYEVAFAYTDDSERADKLSRISAATGLDLPDSP
jgi:hypothetical protein